jgi:sensor histidine kinase YesM
MHPFLRSGKLLIIVGLLWSPLCLWLIFIHHRLTASIWSESLILVLPPMVLELFICLSIWYLCDNIRWNRHSPIRLIFTHVSAMVLVNSGWIGLSFVYSKFLDGVMKTDRWVGNFETSIPIFIAAGVSLYFISVLVYTLIQITETLRSTEQEVLKQKLAVSQSELNALKASIHPHFLFNSLNLIIPLIKKAPQTAQSFITRLSDFLLYTLRYGKKEKVRVEDELEHISNYLAIEGERLGDRLELNIRCQETVRACAIPPLTLLPLIENAIKHGISTCLKRSRLSINIRRTGDFLQVDVTNPYENSHQKMRGEGLGLETLKKRIEVHYGSEAALSLQRGEKTFHATLRLPIVKGTHHEE